MKIPLSCLQLFLTVGGRNPAFPYDGCLDDDEIALFKEIKREIKDPLFDPRRVLHIPDLGASSYLVCKTSFDTTRSWTQDDPLIRLYEARRVWLKEHYSDDPRVST